MSSEYDAYVELLNSQPENIQRYETLSLSHSDFSQTYNLVFDSVDLIATNNNGVLTTYVPANASSTDAQNNNDLDQLASFTLPDLDNTLDDELDRIALGTTEKIAAVYSIYTTGNLDAPADFVEYNVDSVAQRKGVFTIKCGAPKLNKDETGEAFSLARFPMLRTAT